MQPDLKAQVEYQRDDGHKHRHLQRHACEVTLRNISTPMSIRQSLTAAKGNRNGWTGSIAGYFSDSVCNGARLSPDISSTSQPLRWHHSPPGLSHQPQRLRRWPICMPEELSQARLMKLMQLICKKREPYASNSAAVALKFTPLLRSVRLARLRSRSRIPFISGFLVVILTSV